MDRTKFLDGVARAIAQDKLSGAYRKHRASFLLKRLAGLSPKDLAGLGTMPRPRLEALLVSNADLGSTARAQQVSHVGWLHGYLGGPGDNRAPAGGRGTGETVAVPVGDGFVRISGLKRRLAPEEIDRIIQAVRLWAR